MGRKTTCNELIMAEQRERVIELYTKSNTIYADIAYLTGVPIAKIRKMTADLERPVHTPRMTNQERNTLLMQW